MMRALLIVVVGGMAGPLWAQSLRITDLPPMQWVEQVIPEPLPPLKYPEYADVLDRAEMQLRTGRYRLALQTIATSDEADTPRARHLRARTLLAMGRSSEALPVIEQLEPSEQTLLLHGEGLAQQGKRQDAVRILQRGIEQHQDSTQLRLKLATLQESMGHLSAATQTLQWFAEKDFPGRWRDGSLRQIESADELLAIADALDRLAVLAGLYRRDMRLHQDVLAMLLRAYDVLDRRSADAHVRAAAFSIARDDDGPAKQDLERALAINPNSIDAWLQVGDLALDNYDFDAVEKAISSIMAVNPEHPAATLLNAQLLLTQHQAHDAQALVEQLLERDPDNALYLSLMAACDALRYDKQAFEARLSQLDARIPESSLPYDVPARYLLDAFQFRDAARLLHVAVERTPHWNGPRNRLALAYMQQTDTAKALPILEEARRLDPFNVKTTNYLRLLDGILAFEMAKSENFAVRYSPAHDPFLAAEILSYMEAQFPRIAEQFGHAPGERTVIELMPTSEDFAVRTTGKPWIGTVGASAGPLITMVAPRSFGKTNGPFDWCDVLRHEFIHTITLSVTDHRIPRWFTEGLAVAEQSKPLPFDQAQLLAKAMYGNELFPIRRINWAFIRPRKRTDQPLAYAQSLWLCNYIEETHGNDAILKMLSLYREGLHTEQVVQQALGMSTPQLDERFKRWAADEVVRLGMDVISQAQLKALKSDGETAIREARHAEALEIFRKAHEICPGDPTVSQRLAGLYLHRSINQPQAAVKHLRILDLEQLSDNRYAMRLARLHQELEDLPAAIESARRATQLNPYDAAARDLLATVLEKAGEADAAAVQRQRVQTIKELATRKFN